MNFLSNLRAFWCDIVFGPMPPEPVVAELAAERDALNDLILSQARAIRVCLVEDAANIAFEYGVAEVDLYLWEKEHSNV